MQGRMKIIHLKRISYTILGTFGVLLEGKIPFCLTLERLWLNNRKNESCIPVGNYWCRRTQSPKFGNTFKVVNVKNRFHILFHKGNLVEDTHGCIILGEEFGAIQGRAALLSSGRAFQEFMNRMKGLNKFYLQIEDMP